MPNHSNHEMSSSNSVSRRNFLRGAAAATAVAQTVAPIAQAQNSSADSLWGGGGNFGRTQFASLGTYTKGNGGNGDGIYLYKSNPFTGELTLVNGAASTPSPSSLVASASGKFLYAVNEVSNFQGQAGR